MSAAQETILVVEDEAVTALDIQQSLRLKGFHVPDIASSGEEAIKLVRKNQPNLALIDIRLAGQMDGIQTAQAIRAEFCIPIIFLTAYADNETLQRAKTAEPCAYLLKPFEETLLATTIEIAVNKHRGHEALLREAAGAFKLSEDRFRHLVDTIPDHGIQLLDVSGRIVSWNPVAEELYGWGAAEVLGRDFSVLYPETEAAGAQSALESAAHRGRLQEYVPQLRKDGSQFSAEVILTGLRDAQGRPAGYLRVTRYLGAGNN